MRSQIKSLLLAGSGLIVMTAPALALDGQDLLTKFNAAYGPGKGTLSAQSVEVEGNDVVLRGASFQAVAPGAPDLPLGDITAVDVEEGSDGSYEIGEIAVPQFSSSQGETSISFKDMSVSGIHVPASVNGPDLASMLYYRNAQLGETVITNAGKQVASISGGNVKIDPAADNKSLTFSGLIDGISVNLEDVKDPKSVDAIQSLGLQDLSGKISFAGDWNADSGLVNLTEETFDFANVGKLQLKAKISGYTMDLVHQMQQLGGQMSAAKDDQARQASAMAMFGLMQRLNFVGAEIRFDDDGITKRALDFAGKKQGADGEQLAATIKMMAPILLASYKLDDIADSVSAALNTYLDNPKNFTIRANPPQPVPFPNLMATGMNEPQALTKLLSVTVEAND